MPLPDPDPILASGLCPELPWAIPLIVCGTNLNGLKTIPAIDTLQGPEAVIPQEVITGWLGPDSGWLGVLTAVIAGAATPGGPVVGFSIGAVALKAGGGAPQVIAYVVAWALFAFQRVILWEIPFMPAKFVWFRCAVSVPFPFLAAAIAMVIGKP